MTERSILVPEGLEGQRVDAAMSKLLGLSRTAAADICADGGVQMSGRSVIKSDRVIAGERLDIVMPEPKRPVEVVADPVPGMRIVHDEDAFVVVDKPVGVAAHPAIGWTGRTVVGGLAAAGFRIATSGAPERQGIVQRLDVGTSGLMVVAKSEYAYSVLKRAFKERTVDKTYHALVQGLPDPVLGTIDAPIARHPKHDGLYAVRTGGKNAITHYEVIEAHRRAALVEVHLETGRTHQIRVHMKYIGHPLVGDYLYNPDMEYIDRQALHSHRLSFTHPVTGEKMEFTAPLPADMRKILTG